MKTIITLIILTLSTNCFCQSLNDTIPYLNSKIVSNMSNFKNEPLGLVLNNIPYKIKGYRLIKNDPERLENTKLKGVVLFISTISNDLENALNGTFSNNNNNYIPKSLTIYFKDYQNHNYFKSPFFNSFESNNWNNLIESEFRKNVYIVSGIKISGN